MINQEITHVGLDKVQRYGWVTAHAQGRFEMINKRLLNVNTEIYQREASKTKVLELASNWSWIACGALIVADRDGVYWVADGQHRKLAADKRSDIKELPCMVFTVATREAVAAASTTARRKQMHIRFLFHLIFLRTALGGRAGPKGVRKVGGGTRISPSTKVAIKSRQSSLHHLFEQ